MVPRVFNLFWLYCAFGFMSVPSGKMLGEVLQVRKEGGTEIPTLCAQGQHTDRNVQEQELWSHTAWTRTLAPQFSKFFNLAVP